MARSIWKGAISFGLVHIPVSLTTAVSSTGVDFDWLDKRTMDPVGYKQINKATGKEIDRKNIVKGVQYEKGRYVVLSEEEIKTAHPRATQTIDIFSFIDKAEIPITHIDTPYYLAPDKRGEKVYALLREALNSTGKVALANVILRVRQHLAVLMPVDSALVLILLRWPAEVRDMGVLDLSDSVVEPQLAKSEKEMAKRLINDMSATWEPEEYQDSFQEKIMALVEQKAREGKIEDVEQLEDQGVRKSADIIDLTELLKRSLTGNSKSATRGADTEKVRSIKGSAKKGSGEESGDTEAKPESEKVGSRKAVPKKTATKTASKKAASTKGNAEKNKAKPNASNAKSSTKTGEKKTEKSETTARKPRRAAG